MVIERSNGVSADRHGAWPQNQGRLREYRSELPHDEPAYIDVRSLVSLDIGKTRSRRRATIGALAQDPSRGASHYGGAVSNSRLGTSGGECISRADRRDETGNMGAPGQTRADGRRPHGRDSSSLGEKTGNVGLPGRARADEGRSPGRSGSSLRRCLITSREYTPGRDIYPDARRRRPRGRRVRRRPRHGG